MTQRYCRNCGAELRAGDRFCSECGQQVDAGSESGVGGESGDAWGESANSWDNPQQSQQSDTWGESTGGARHGTATTEQGYGQGYAHGRQPNTGMAALTHLLALFTWFVGPLVVYLVTDDPFVERNAANAVNWQLMLALYLIISFFLIFVVVGFFLMFILAFLDLAFIIIAALKAGDGEAWTYPLTPEIL